MVRLVYLLPGLLLSGRILVLFGFGKGRQRYAAQFLAR